jgi:hypothetical protein
LHDTLDQNLLRRRRDAAARGQHGVGAGRRREFDRQHHDSPDGDRLASYKNFNLGIGGPLVKDRVWGHFAYLNQSNSVAAPPAGSILDGTPFDTKLFNYTGEAGKSGRAGGDCAESA